MGSVGRDTRTIFHERAHSKAPRTPRIRRYIDVYLARTIPNNTKLKKTAPAPQKRSPAVKTVWNIRVSALS